MDMLRRLFGGDEDDPKPRDPGPVRARCRLTSRRSNGTAISCARPRRRRSKKAHAEAFAKLTPEQRRHGTARS